MTEENNENNYLEINKKLWNEKTAYHIHSSFYDVEGFMSGKTSLQDIELNLLGNISQKKILHLQCHFGQDSLSLARLGAEVTGVDLADNAIEEAKNLSKKSGVPASFICSDIYDLPEILNDKFDLVFTSYGTIGWLPDLDKWAKVISHFLKPGGRFIFVEFHPVVWMFDNDFKFIQYNYFKSGAIVETEQGTYADQKAEINLKSISWNHSLGEVFHSLLTNGLSISSFEEFDYSPYNCFNQTVETAPGKFRIKHLENKIPMVYALVAEKK